MALHFNPQTLKVLGRVKGFSHAVESEQDNKVVRRQVDFRVKGSGDGSVRSLVIEGTLSSCNRKTVAIPLTRIHVIKDFGVTSRKVRTAVNLSTLEVDTEFTDLVDGGEDVRLPRISMAQAWQIPVIFDKEMPLAQFILEQLFWFNGEENDVNDFMARLQRARKQVLPVKDGGMKIGAVNYIFAGEVNKGQEADGRYFVRADETYLVDSFHFETCQTKKNMSWRRLFTLVSDLHQTFSHSLPRGTSCN